MLCVEYTVYDLYCSVGKPLVVRGIPERALVGFVVFLLSLSFSVLPFSNVSIVSSLAVIRETPSLLVVGVLHRRVGGRYWGILILEPPSNSEFPV